MNQTSKNPEQRTPGHSNSALGTARDNYTSVERFLPRLDGVRQTGPNTWTARSPCREDRTASVSIKHVDDRLLIHDFGGNSPDEIMRAVGLTLADLYDRPLNHLRKPLSRFERKRHDQARDALRALTHECRVIGVLAEQMAAGFALDPVEKERLNLAMQRVENARRLAA